MGMYLSWYNLAYVCLVPTLMCLFLMTFNPESPTFLLMKGRETEAAEALQRFRGRHYDISFEFDEMKLMASTAFTKISLSEFKLPSVYKPLTIVLVLIVFKLLSGINTVNVNMAYIFKLSKSPVPEHIGSIICALVELLSAVLSGLIMETAGRKVLLLASAFGMAITHTLLGTYFYILQTQESVAHAYLAWLPLSCILVYSFMFSVGFGTIPFILIGELLPPAIKEQASALAMAVHWTTAFVTVFAFDPLQVRFVLWTCVLCTRVLCCTEMNKFLQHVMFVGGEYLLFSLRCTSFISSISLYKDVSVFLVVQS
ncbi:Major facilitator sugar transporter-like [Trinorchestia longiramus]|nr:Major facilitator sugar transporter-like [Trinorchestia longiramus]